MEHPIYPLGSSQHYAHENPVRAQRTDIQVLRAFAVLIVVFYHAKLGYPTAGYLGVDVFFVISGFLITRLVKEQIEQQCFSFILFYKRRALRLLPAAYATFLVTTLAAPYFLATRELNDYREQLLGALTFSSNFVLWKQSGYFEGAAYLKPLLHTWSLAIEEQYYLLLPALLVFIPYRFWKVAALTMLFASLASCAYFMSRDATAAFYLLPMRGWELAIGSLGALLASTWTTPSATQFLKFSFWPSLIILLGLPWFPIGALHPGVDALLICVATLLIILRAHPLLSTGLLVDGMRRVGDISYSLYLVHWPLFALLVNAWIGKDGVASVPLWVRIMLVVSSIVIAFGLHRWVEQPARHSSISPLRLLLAAIGGAVGLLGLQWLMAINAEPAKDYATIRRANYGLNQACEFNTAFSPIPKCRNSQSPTIAVWGDSYAMHLVPGLISATPPPAIVQATKSVCGPLLDVAPMDRRALETYGRNWAEECLAFNDSVYKYLRDTPAIETVIMSSPFIQYVDNTKAQLVVRDDSGAKTLADASVEIAIQQFAQTVSRLRAIHKKVVVVAPPPQGAFNIGNCLERKDRGLLVFGGSNSCSIELDEYRKRNALVLTFLAALSRTAGVEVIDFEAALCQGGRCRTSAEGVFIYRDGGHFSVDGSVRVLGNGQLLNRTMQAAR